MHNTRGIHTVDTSAFLIVHKGSPHGEGSIFPLSRGRMLIGRASPDHEPDIAFDDLRISRKHAEITYDEGRFVLLDTSRHGTEVNGMPLAKGEPYVLNARDNIGLAKGTVMLEFSSQHETAETLPLLQERIAVDENRREVLLDGEELRPRLGGHEFELIALLYRNQGKAVKHADTIDWVWANVPNRDTITHQDVNTLAYRLRRCLGEYGRHIVNIPSYGYRLDQRVDS